MRHVCFTSKSGHWNSVAECPLCAKSRHSALRQIMTLFDHVVGELQEMLGNVEPKRFCGLEVDDKL